tara:strand:+ start:167 stop:547 length:381 start_codon:yes stop_codon:yes gene_type:complete
MKSFLEYITEVDSYSTRMKKRAAFRKNKAKILLKRKKAMKKANFDPKKLENKARKRARMILIKKMIKDKDYNTFSIGQKKDIEKKLEKKKSAIAKIAKKLLPQVKKSEAAKRKPKVKMDKSGVAKG